MSDRPDAARDESQKLPSLLVRGRRGDPMAVQLRRRSILLGRHKQCMVRLIHRDISMRHAMAIRFNAGIYLLDLESRTGIRWGGETRAGGWLNGMVPAMIKNFSIVDDSPDAAPDLADPTRGFLGDVERIPDVELEFTEGPLQGTSYRIKRSITLIGRGSRCKVRLRDDADISRIHACLLLDESGLYLVDTLSRLGMLVDGQPAQQAALREGQRFQVGKHVIEVTRCRLAGTGCSDASADLPLEEPAVDIDHPEHGLAQSLIELRDVAESERTEQVDALLEAGTISAWQSRKIRRKDPTRLILDDRYLMMAPVARGGMATVYRAFDLETSEAVALKLPEMRGNNAKRRFARFRREISISSSLRHPHIVAMRDTGRSLRFLVFDFVRGKTLSRLMAEHGSLDPTFVVQWFIQIADALAYAQGKGVIHRDIKPDNIMITENNSAMLLDMGLACLSQGEGDSDGAASAALTRIGFTVGTLTFMSPEQAAAANDIDCRADIYSLACTMFAALSGHPPFQARNPALLVRQHLEEPPPLIPNLDPDLTHILERAMEKLPGDRFQTPEELRDALKQWLTVPAAGAC